ncbi:MAG: hypothetical protein ACI9BD_001577, partial [Candidatus Marinamargulisbacteria bacterium]
MNVNSQVVGPNPPPHHRANDKPPAPNLNQAEMAQEPLTPSIRMAPITRYPDTGPQHPDQTLIPQPITYAATDGSIQAIRSRVLAQVRPSTMEVSQWIPSLEKNYDVASMIQALATDPAQTISPEQAATLREMLEDPKEAKQPEYARSSISLFQQLGSGSTSLAKLEKFFQRDSNDTQYEVNRTIKKIAKLLIIEAYFKKEGFTGKLAMALEDFPQNFACRAGT